MTVEEYLSNQPIDNRSILSEIHLAILNADKKVKAQVEPMMGKEIIVYKASGIFKYGLSNGKLHMTLHAMPIYCSTELHSKYKGLLPNTTFQKGCINFKNENLPLAIAKKLLKDCAKIDLLKIRNEYLNAKKK